MRVLGFVLVLCIAACSDPVNPPTATVPPILPSFALNLSAPSVALIDMGTAYTYKGLAGGLYPGGTNTPPLAHVTAGLNAAAQVRPLSATGVADPNGKIVMLSIGMSNANYEFCEGSNGSSPIACAAGSVIRRWWSDPATKKANRKLVNGARFGRTIPYWDSPTDPQYDWVKTYPLTANKVTEKQVQIVWLKDVITYPSVPLPNANANAYQERAGLKRIIAAAKARYPNLRMVFLSPRTYGGWGTTGQSPEPYAFESAFAVKWVVEDYIKGLMPALPFVTWGPYLWAKGDTPRSDGVKWPRSYFGTDGIHPNATGIAQAGLLIHNFFKQSPFAPWYD